jgi:hypothetical protein
LSKILGEILISHERAAISDDPREEVGPGRGQEGRGCHRVNLLCFADLCSLTIIFIIYIADLLQRQRENKGNRSQRKNLAEASRGKAERESTVGK